MASKMDGVLSQGAQFTPWGAGLSVAAEAINTPNTSAATAGDFFAGSQTFGTGIQTGGFGGSLPTWALIGAAALALVWYLRKR